LTSALLWDTHAHLTDRRFEASWEQVMEEALEAGVHGVVNVGIDPETSRRALAQAERFPGRMAVTVGLHPHEAKRYSSGMLDELRETAREGTAVAVGEIGLDYHYMMSEKGAQRKAFHDQVEMAVDLGLPVVIHSRDAEEDVVAMLKDFRDRGRGGVLHCYTGGTREAGRALDLGYHVSFTGIVTFRDGSLDALVRYVPLERLLLETDSPYLAPVPHRGKTNSPALLPLIAERMASLREMPVGALIEAASENATALFGIGG
jgi:TatD DNase family protein